MRTKRKSHTWLVYAALVSAYALVFTFYRAVELPASVHAMGVAVWALWLAPLAIWYQRGHRGTPMFELICLACGLAYGPPLYTVANKLVIASQELTLPWEMISQALLLVLLGLGALFGGYYLTRGLIGGLFLPAVYLDLPIRPRAHAVCTYSALLVGLGGKVMEVLWPAGAGGLGAITNLLAGQYSIGIILLSYEVFSKPARVGQVILLWGSVATGSLFGLSDGMMEGTFLPLVLVVIVRWHVRGRFPWGLTALGAALFLMLNPIKAEYRNRTWFGAESGLGPVARLWVWVEVAKDYVAGNIEEDPTVETKDSVSGAWERIDLLHKFAYVRGMTPEEVPYFHGKTYSYLMYSLIPRFLWAEKPIATEATDLVDFSYHFRSPEDEKQSAKIAIGQIAEAYANFGWQGILVVMLLQGVIFAVLDKVLNSPQSEGGRAIYLSAMVLFLNGIGTAAVILFGSILQYIVASALLMRPFALGFRYPKKQQRIRPPRHIPETAEAKPG